MTTKLNLRNHKLALGKANGEAMLPAETEDLLEVIHMGREVLAEDGNDLNLDKTEGKLTQDEVHHMLKGVPSFPEAKGHPQKFEHPKGGDNSSLLNVLGSHGNLIKPLLKIQLGEHSRTRDPVPSAMLGRGYWSGIVTLFSFWKSPQGLHPSFFS